MALMPACINREQLPNEQATAGSERPRRTRIDAAAPISPYTGYRPGDGKIGLSKEAAPRMYRTVTLFR